MKKAKIMMFVVIIMAMVAGIFSFKVKTDLCLFTLDTVANPDVCRMVGEARIGGFARTVRGTLIALEDLPTTVTSCSQTTVTTATSLCTQVISVTDE